MIIKDFKIPANFKFLVELAGKESHTTLVFNDEYGDEAHLHLDEQNDVVATCHHPEWDIANPPAIPLMSNAQLVETAKASIEALEVRMWADIGAIEKANPVLSDALTMGLTEEDTNDPEYSELLKLQRIALGLRDALVTLDEGSWE